MSERKAVFFDIDGTLWDEANVIPESTVRTIKALQEHGHLTFLCTGRAKGFLGDPKLQALHFDGIVCGGGTMIEYNGEVLENHLLSTEKLEKVLLVLGKLGCFPILEGPECMYIPETDYENLPFLPTLQVDVENCLSGIKENWGTWKVNKFSLALPDGKQADVIEALSEEYECLCHTPTIIETLPKGFSKAEGIRKVCGYLGLDMKDTVAFGDSVNDYSMIVAAGTGICMGNGSEELKKVADYVTTSLHEDGIEAACRHFGWI